MFGEGHNDSIVQRGIDEALACQDMLERAPPTPSLAARVAASIAAFARSFIPLERATDRGVDRPLPAISIHTSQGDR